MIFWMFLFSIAQNLLCIRKIVTIVGHMESFWSLFINYIFVVRYIPFHSIVGSILYTTHILDVIYYACSRYNQPLFHHIHDIYIKSKPKLCYLSFVHWNCKCVSIGFHNIEYISVTAEYGCNLQVSGNQ